MNDLPDPTPALPEEDCPRCRGTGYTTHTYQTTARVRQRLAGVSSPQEFLEALTAMVRDARALADTYRRNSLGHHAELWEVEAEALAEVRRQLWTVMQLYDLGEPRPRRVGLVKRLWLRWVSRRSGQ